jgi:hypothetical protein
VDEARLGVQALGWWAGNARAAAQALVLREWGDPVVRPTEARRLLSGCHRLDAGSGQA